jgi:hypothetical protein
MKLSSNFPGHASKVKFFFNRRAARIPNPFTFKDTRNTDSDHSQKLSFSDSGGYKITTTCTQRSNIREKPRFANVEMSLDPKNGKKSISIQLSNPNKTSDKIFNGSISDLINHFSESYEAGPTSQKYLASINRFFSFFNSLIKQNPKPSTEKNLMILLSCQLFTVKKVSEVTDGLIIAIVGCNGNEFDIELDNRNNLGRTIKVFQQPNENPDTISKIRIADISTANQNRGSRNSGSNNNQSNTKKYDFNLDEAQIPVHKLKELINKIDNFNNPHSQ